MGEIKFRIPAFAKLLGMEIIQASEGSSRIRLPFKEDLCNRAGFVHGGAIASLADCAVGAALLSLIPDVRAATVDLDIKYLLPAKSALVAEAKIIHRGQTTAVGDVEIRDEKNELVAKASATYAILE